MSPVITFGGLLGEATKANIVSLKAWHLKVSTCAFRESSGTKSETQSLVLRDPHDCSVDQLLNDV